MITHQVHCTYSLSVLNQNYTFSRTQLYLFSSALLQIHWIFEVKNYFFLSTIALTTMNRRPNHAKTPQIALSFL